MSEAKATFGIYIHWPFCQSKCPYCDFNSHVAEPIDPAAWTAAYLAELSYYAKETSHNTVSSLFFGGGTPSLMPTVMVAAIINAVHDHWNVAENVEITAEANPSSSDAKTFAGFAEAGVNRLSLGVQSFNDQALKLLGREHNSFEAMAAITKAQQNFPRVSFDLIYGLPGETEATWNKTLETALTLASEHLSAYQLTIEPGTEFHRRRTPAAEPELGAQLFEMTREILAGAGMPAYEISNHASSGAECQHNLIYWRGEDYLGIGPGAHGRISRHAEDSYEIATTLAVRKPGAWLASVEETGSGVQKRQRLSLSERRDEIFLMGLRLGEGVSACRFRQKTGVSIEESVDPSSLASLTGENYLITDTKGLRATEAGFLCLDAVLAHLLTGAPDLDVGR